MKRRTILILAMAVMASVVGDTSVCHAKGGGAGRPGNSRSGGGTGGSNARTLGSRAISSRLNAPLSAGLGRGSGLPRPRSVALGVQRNVGGGLKKSSLQQVARHVSSKSVRKATERVARWAPARHCVRYRHARWWLDFACGFQRYSGRPWDCYPGYWDLWRPCSYVIVPCQDFRYYVGLQCVTIPDLNCLGIESVQPDSPAALAGLRPGDIILSVNGKPLGSEDILLQEIATGKLSFEVLRDGDEVPTSIAFLPQRLS